MARARVNGMEGAGRASLVALIAGVVMAAAGCGGETSPEPRPSAGSPSASASTTSEASPEIGTWETDPISRAAFVRTLREAGFQEHVPAFEQREDWLPKKQAVMSLELLDGSWTLYAALDTRPPAVFDKQTYELEDDRVVVTSGVGQSVFTFTVDEADLTLSFVSSTEPEVEGVPVEAILRNYYTTAPFHRVAS
jgi:hypothetical protein